MLSFILENEDKIGNGNLDLCYHKSCRVNFMLPVYQNISDKENCGDNRENMQVQVTRSKTAEFNWKIDCFICGQKCHEKKRKTWCYSCRCCE